MAEEKQETRAQEQLVDLGSATTRSSRGNIYTLTIIGQIEGHQALPENVKTTKYEHILPQLAAIEDSDEIGGVLVLLNTMGGDVEAGLAINTPILKSFADAKASLDKCKAYGARYICLPHFGLIPQDFNEEYWDRFEQGCEDRIQMAREMKAEGLEADQMLERYRDRYWDPIMEQEQPIEAFLINAKNIIKAALRALEMEEK